MLQSDSVLTLNTHHLTLNTMTISGYIYGIPGTFNGNIEFIFMVMKFTLVIQSISKYFAKSLSYQL